MKTVYTKIDHYFLDLLDKHFPKNPNFHGVFNRNSVKVVWKNIKSITNQNETISNKIEKFNKKNATVLIKTRAH